MRPRYVVLTLALAAAVAFVAAAAISGKSPDALIDDLAQTGKSWIAALSSPAPEKGKGAGGGATQGSPPTVVVSQPVQRKIIEWDEYTGRFDAIESVEVRARVSGYLNEVKFTDGQEVKQGDLLFLIDPRPFERALDQARAELNQARVRVSNADIDVQRGRPLAQRSIISQKTQDDRENLVRDAEAAVKVAESRVKTAELELSFCRIEAPISGRISRTLVTAGNFISGGGTPDGTTVLTTIVSQDPIYIYFDVSENDALKYKRLAERGVQDAATVGAAVGVGLPDEQGFPHSGKLDFLDNRLDTGTGTLRARARVDNKHALFSAGMFARVRLQGSPEYTALLLPDEAIGTDQASRYVYVVGADDMPVRQGVKLGPLVDGLRVIRDGIDADDWTIIRGQQRVRPNLKVTPKREPLTVSDAAQPKGGVLLQKR